MSETNSIPMIDEANADEAYERILPEAMAVPENSLATINVDITSAIITAIGVSQRLQHLEKEMSDLPNFPIEAVKKFQDYILALFSAQSRYTFATTPPEQLPEILERATTWRDILIADAKALVARGHLNGEPLKELTGTHGYKNVAFDLSGLSRLLKTAWPSIEEHTGLKMTELIEVDKLALKLATAVAHREMSPEQASAAADVRQRMFTLFCKTYDEIRRAIGYLRWHQEDGDTFAPSLYAGRPNSNIGKKNGDTNKPNETASGAPAAAAAPAAAKVPVGFPGSEPLSV